jgi:hypothetical protein
MAQITSGKFLYGRVVKDDDYGIKREFIAELSFGIGENESPDEIMGYVAQKVVDIAHAKLRLPAAAPTGAAVEVQARPGSPPPAPPPAAAPAPVNDKERLAAQVVAAATPAVVKPKRAPKLVEPAPEAAPDDLSALFGDEPAKEIVKPITDKELNDAVQHKNATLKNPPKIVALKEKFAGPLPKALRDIPQEKRAQFLTELAALS